MSRILDKFNRKKNPYFAATQVNPEGFPSFKRSLEEAYIQILLTNTLSGTFYADEDTLFDDSLQLHAEMAAKDTGFMARALVYARNEGLMRLQPIVGLAYLAKADREWFRKAFKYIIQTPGDLSDFVEIVRGEVIPGGMGRCIKNVVNAWLNEMSEYHAIKYATGGQGYSLRDILRVSHPKPSNDTQDAIFMWLADTTKWAASEKRSLTHQIEAFEQLKRASGDIAQARSLIETGRLPYEVVTGTIKPDPETWVYLMKQMPYFALLRHLNTLQRGGVLKEHAEYVAERLVNESAIRKAKILPFRLFMAYQMFMPQTPEEGFIRDALIQALEVAFVNMPAIGEKTCIAPDVSGSMTGYISKKSKVRCIDIAGIFTGTLLKKSEKSMVLPFDDKVISVNLSPHDSIMTNAEKIAQLGGGGTAISAPISDLLDKQIKIDTFIGITDNIEWATDQTGRTGFLPTWNNYKERVAPAAKAFLITIAPYRHAVAPSETPDVHYIYGWNDSVVKFITLSLEGMDQQVHHVQSMQIL